MRYVLSLAMLITMPCYSQTAQTGKAETTGLCSPAVSGSNNQFTITCQNIPDKLRGQLIDLLNRVAKNQADAGTILGKLDTCLEGIKQVRAQAAPWNLVDSQREQLKQLLKGSKAKFQVHVITADRNASLLGMDLFSVLSDSGWDPGKTGLIPDFTLNPALVGIYIVVTHKDFPEAALLQSALHSILGIQVDAQVDDVKNLNKQNDLIYIAIGAKPPVAVSMQ